MALPESEPLTPPVDVEEPEDAREAWLSLALSDVGGAAALATAARGGRPLPRREPDGA